MINSMNVFSTLHFSESTPSCLNAGDVYFDDNRKMLMMWDGNQWVTAVMPIVETPEQKAMRELKEFLDMKGISEEEIKDFFESRRLVERMQEW